MNPPENSDYPRWMFNSETNMNNKGRNMEVSHNYRSQGEVNYMTVNHHKLQHDSNLKGLGYTARILPEIPDDLKWMLNNEPEMNNRCRSQGEIDHTTVNHPKCPLNSSSREPNKSAINPPEIPEDLQWMFNETNTDNGVQNEEDT